MNANQLKGKWMRFKGELKQQYGKFTDDALRQIGGNYEKFIGKVQERIKSPTEWMQLTKTSDDTLLHFS